MNIRTPLTFLFLVLLPVAALAGYGPTLGEHEQLEKLISDTTEAELVAIEQYGNTIEVVVRYDGEFRYAIDFNERIMTIFELTFVEKDWTILSLEPERAVTLRRQFRGKSRPCGHVAIECKDVCIVGVIFPNRCDLYDID